MTTTNKSTPVRTFGEACKPFTNAGIRAKALLPVAPPGAPVCEKSSLARDPNGLGKKQGRFDARRGVWTGLGTDAVTKGLDAYTLKAAQSWPTGNVAVLGRLLPGIDVDAGSEEFSRLAYQALVEMFGDGDNNGESFAERLRGEGLSRTYSFRAYDPNAPIRTRRMKIRMPGDDPNAKARHGVDIQGMGTYYLIAGTHPSRDEYHWHPDRDLAEMHRDNRLLSITDEDTDRFLQRLTELVEAAGGEVVHASGGGTGGGKRRDYGFEEPIAPPQQIIDALKEFPNTEANLPLREDLVKALAAIRAALGLHAPEVEWASKVRAWAVETSDGYCDDDYFDQIWDSLDKGVDCPQDKLPRLLRDLGGVRSLDGAMARRDFPDDAPAVSREISGLKAYERNEREKLLDRVAEKYIFQHIDTSKGKKFQPMRLRTNANNELDAAAWYKGQSTDRDSKLLAEIRAEFGKSPDDLFYFLRELLDRHPLAFYQGETKNPRYEFGAIVPMPSDPNHPEGKVNLRRQAQAQIAARRGRKDPNLARADLEHILDFIRRGFGDEECPNSEGISEKFVLDILAHMMQTGDRPGHMIYLVGDQGTGKSIFVEMLIALFDGTWPDTNGRINGAKLTNESARRFIWERTEGCRVIAVQEMPKNAKTADKAAILSEVKQAVDPGPGGDWLQVEGKRGQIKHIQNHALVIVTTNYEEALEIEEQDRRTFYVPFRITIANKPNREFYTRLVDITMNPERLAAVVQYLMHRDITGYRVTDAPPNSAEKSALQMAGISDSAERHMEIALRTLGHNDRWLYTLDDIIQLMNEASRREPGNDDGPEPYSAGAVGRNGISHGAWARLAKHTEKRSFKSNGERFSTLYTPKAGAPELTALKRSEAFRALELDRQQHPLVEMVRIEPYRGALSLLPLDKAEAGAGEDEMVPHATSEQRRHREGRRLH